MPAAPTTLVLVRHGVTEHTTQRRFSGGLTSSDPPLADEGREQIRAVGEWLAPSAERVDAIVTSPVRRARESAAVLGEVLGREVDEEPGFAEMEFGAWDGRTFSEVAEEQGDALEAWLGSLDVAPGGTGESFRTVQERVLGALERVLADHAGRTVVVTSHVTPIKVLVAHVLDAPLLSIFRMELVPASVTVLTFHPEDEPGPRSSLRLFNAVAPDRAVLRDPQRW
ncbi:MAG TPA: histidine phosphatase family protein [Nocardioides sp.]|nr:histidine phosphatase family protein [Nocardioides sp.]